MKYVLTYDEDFGYQMCIMICGKYHIDDNICVMDSELFIEHNSDYGWVVSMSDVNFTESGGDPKVKEFKDRKSLMKEAWKTFKNECWMEADSTIIRNLFDHEDQDTVYALDLILREVL